LAWLVEQWRQSAEWLLTSQATKRQRENILHHVLERNGNKPFSEITKEHIKTGRKDRLKTPFAANNFVKTMRALFRWAHESDLVDADPAHGVKVLRVKTNGFPPWTADDVALYRDRWAIGTRERLAMELIRYTGLRRGDVVRLGRQHIKDGMAMIRAEKTGVMQYAPFPPELEAIVADSPTGDLAFIATRNKRPMVKEAFGNWFGESCRKAGIEKSAHGLRKLAATTLAEQGGSEHELQAVFGWQSGRMSQTYTREADKQRLAKRAAARVGT
jgi:integrase